MWNIFSSKLRSVAGLHLWVVVATSILLSASTRAWAQDSIQQHADIVPQ